MLENVEDWQPGSTEDSVTQRQPSVPGPSSHIQDAIPPPPPAATSNQWQGFMYPVHAGDPLCGTPREDPFAGFEFPEVSLLCFKLSITTHLCWRMLKTSIRETSGAPSHDPLLPRVMTGHVPCARTRFPVGRSGTGTNLRTSPFSSTARLQAACGAEIVSGNSRGTGSKKTQITAVAANCMAALLSRV